jgi:hypothetical protein
VKRLAPSPTQPSHNPLAFQSHLSFRFVLILVSIPLTLSGPLALFLSFSLSLSLSGCNSSAAAHTAGHFAVRIRQPRCCRVDRSLDCRRRVVRHSFIEKSIDMFSFSVFGYASCTVSCSILIAWCPNRASEGALPRPFLLQNFRTLHDPHNALTSSIPLTHSPNLFIKNAYTLSGAFC